MSAETPIFPLSPQNPAVFRWLHPELFPAINLLFLRLRFLKNAWKYGYHSGHPKRDLEFRRPKRFWFRRLPRTRSGVRLNNGASNFCKSLGYFPKWAEGLLPILGLFAHRMSKIFRSVLKFGGKKCKNVQETIPERGKLENGRRSWRSSGFFDEELEKNLSFLKMK